MRCRVGLRKENKINKHDLTITEQLAELVSSLQLQRTGHAPRAASVILSEETLVVTLHDALTPVEQALTKSPAGAAQVQEFHRQLFASCTDEMRREIKRITGRDVREAAAEIETATGTCVHAFTSGAMVQVFLLKSTVNRDRRPNRDFLDYAGDDGLRVTPIADRENGSNT